MPQTRPSSPDLGGSGHNGDDYTSNGNGHGGQPPSELPLVRIGFWLLIASLSTMFGALASTYLYRMAEKADYAFPWPPTLWISTVAIVVSSVTLHLAQKKVVQGRMRTAVTYLTATVALGWVFVISQIVSWMLLESAGFYAQTNPFAGLFYILTAVHGVHLLGGVAWLIYVYYLGKLGIMTSKKHLAFDLGAIYWHFMMVVWLVFFALIVL